MWTRSAFYEKEGEVLIFSKAFASELQHKFRNESEKHCIQVSSAQECVQFLPSGCALCKGFGPFYGC